MTDIPTISFRALIQKVKRFGFEPVRQKGSHIRFVHPDGRKTTIPDYNCEMDDAALLTMANNEKRILITNDKDFGELVFLRKQNSVGIILIRVKGQDTKEKVELVEKLILNYKEKIPNHFSLITKTKFRFIPLEGIV